MMSSPVVRERLPRRRGGSKVADWEANPAPPSAVMSARAEGGFFSARARRESGPATYQGDR